MANLCPHGKNIDENKRRKIDDSELPAGSPMHFYCKCCKDLADTLPETWDPRFQKPRKFCADCKNKK